VWISVGAALVMEVGTGGGCGRPWFCGKSRNLGGFGEQEGNGQGSSPRSKALPLWEEHAVPTGNEILETSTGWKLVDSMTFRNGWTGQQSLATTGTTTRVNWIGTRHSSRLELNGGWTAGGVKLLECSGEDSLKWMDICANRCCCPKSPGFGCCCAC